MKLPFIISLLIVLQISCSKEKYFGGPNSFTDDFESYATSDSLFPSDESRWSFNQKTKEENFIAIDTVHRHSGNRSLKFFAIASDESEVSKCSLVKQHMAFYEGDVVTMSAWYYIEGTQQADWLFLFDFEEQAAVGAGPGMRIANTENNYVAMESKFNNPTIYQTAGSEIALPRNQWVHLELEIKPEQKKKGYVRIWQDGQLILSKDDCKTLPQDFLYSQQGTKGMYTSIEFGITANTKNNNTTLYMDDIRVQVK